MNNYEKKFNFKIFLKDFIYLREKQSTRLGMGRGRGKADSPLSREPDMEFDLRTPGS